MSRALFVVSLSAALAACDRAADPAGRSRGVPPRVVPASASAVDYLGDLGAFDLVVALPAQAARYANGLPAGGAPAGLPRFTAFHSEAILALEPDVVICDWYQAGATTAVLERHGIRVVAVEAVEDLASIERNIVRVGRAIGRAAAGLRRARAFRAGVCELQAGITASRPLVLPYFDYGTGARTAGRGTIENLMIDLAGGRNWAAVQGLAGHGPLPVERVLARPPRFFLTGDGAEVAALRASTALHRLDAVRRDRILTLPARCRDASSPYLLAAARRLRRLLREHGAW